MVETAATIPATIAAGAAVTPNITAPTAVNAIPKSFKISFTILQPFSHMEKKLVTANAAPPTTDATPAIVVATEPKATVIVSFSVSPENAPSMANPIFVPSVENCAKSPVFKAVPIPALAAISTPNADAIAAVMQPKPVPSPEDAEDRKLLKGGFDYDEKI